MASRKGKEDREGSILGNEDERERERRRFDILECKCECNEAGTEARKQRKREGREIERESARRRAQGTMIFDLCPSWAAGRKRNDCN